MTVPVLVDTSVWVDHLGGGEAALAALLAQDAVLLSRDKSLVAVADRLGVGVVAAGDTGTPAT